MSKRWFLTLAGCALVAALVLPARLGAQAADGYAGSSACADCHEKEVAQFAGTGMGKLMLGHPRTAREQLGCESCHGPAKAHAESGADERGGLISFGRKSPNPVSQRNDVCLGCHERTARLMWKGSAHEMRDVACTDCHAVMHPSSERGNLREGSVLATCGRCHQQRQAQQLRFAHMPLGEGKMECTSCHNPHGSPNEKLLIAATVNETCYSCHAEKRGPFLWEHAPVAESCSNCHDAHGSNHEKMLKTSKPRLCQQCHDDTRHPANPQRFSTPAFQTSGSRILRGRQCLNCHIAIHGSNHPSAALFTR